METPRPDRQRAAVGHLQRVLGVSEPPNATSCHGSPTIRMRRCPPGCTTTPRTIRDGVSARVSQRSRSRLGNQSLENAMPLTRRRASSATAPPAQRPRQQDRLNRR